MNPGTDQPKTVDDLLQAIKSILAYLIRRWAQIEEKLNDGFCIAIKAKTDYLKEYASTDQHYADFRADHKHDRAGFDLIDRQLRTMQKHSAMYMELINSVRTLQGKALRFAVLEAKVMGGGRTMISTVEERIEWTRLNDEIYKMYASFLGEAAEKRGSMGRDEDKEEEAWRDFDRRMAEDGQKADTAVGDFE